MQNAEVRRFKPDENLIFTLITSQDSTVKSALRELVQNAYDAEATECRVELSAEGFRVSDNGRGFASEQEVEEFFETFGKPHQAGREEKFGRFRMGRCQIMAFAPTTWHSNRFIMQVDIKQRGLEYDLQRDAAEQLGCEIAGRWYQPLTGPEMAQIARSLQKYFEFFYRMPVWVNGERISRTFEELGVTLETPDFYVVRDDERPELSVYNLGIYTEQLWAHGARWQLRGSLISKHHLPLDISRGHWLTQGCAIRARLEQTLRQHFTPPHRRSNNLSQAEIETLLHALRADNTTMRELRGKKIFHSPSRTHRYSLQDLTEKPFTFAWPGNERLADKISQRGYVLVLSLEDITEVFEGETYGGRLAGFFAALDQLQAGDEQLSEEDAVVVQAVHRNYHRFERVAERHADYYALLDESELTPTELCAFKAIELAHQRQYRRVAMYHCYGKCQVPRNVWTGPKLGPYYKAHPQREIKVGDSAATATGWTDGEHYIALNRELLKRLGKGVKGADFVAAVVVHEWCHVAANPSEHNAEFYKAYHDLTCNRELDLLTSFALEINSSYATFLKRAGLPVPEAVKRYLTGRAAQDERQEKAFGKLMVDYWTLENQLERAEEYLLLALVQSFEPDLVPADHTQKLRNIVAEMTATGTNFWRYSVGGRAWKFREQDWLKLREAKSRFSAYNSKHITKDKQGRPLTSSGEGENN